MAIARVGSCSKNEAEVTYTPVRKALRRREEDTHTPVKLSLLVE